MTSRAHELYKQIVDSENPAAILKSMVDDKRTESEFLEFKGAGRIDDKGVREYWSETLSAFANTEGGVLIWGISTNLVPHPDDPDGKIDAASGYDLAKNPVAFVQRLKDLLMDACVDPVQGVEFLPVAKEKDDGESGFVVCLVPEGRHKPYRATRDRKRQYYQRAGDNSVVISHSMLRSLFYPVTSACLSLRMWKKKPRVTTEGDDWKIFVDLQNTGQATARDIYVQWDEWSSDFMEAFEWNGPNWRSRTSNGSTYELPLHPGESVHFGCMHFHRTVDEGMLPYLPRGVQGAFTFYMADHVAQEIPFEFSNDDFRYNRDEKCFPAVHREDQHSPNDD